VAAGGDAGGAVAPGGHSRESGTFALALFFQHLIFCMLLLY